MNLNKEEYKKLVKEIKKEIVDNAKTGGYQQRVRLLCYGFLRGIPYRQIESKINEDKFGPGLNTFRYYLEGSIYLYLKKKGISQDIKEEILDWLKVPLVQEDKFIIELINAHLENSSESVDVLYPAIKFKDEKYRVWPPKLDSEPLTEEEAESFLQAVCDNEK